MSDRIDWLEDDEREPIDYSVRAKPRETMLDMLSRITLSSHYADNDGLLFAKESRETRGEK